MSKITNLTMQNGIPPKMFHDIEALGAAIDDAIQVALDQGVPMEAIMGAIELAKLSLARSFFDELDDQG
ncbi:hypothetical protein IQ22_03355 [Pseudomonas duriflava]|uniref:Uncharacterized protein n=1 Tax=Pseudomonas duriflava TaxID=459528 RepID=A0A562Q739_9PSED|nr:hypothetical protein [Pseudomonas duriflava]TWI52585.1 hypothetical protein IQ22_03355 [Pseudomonas duriflava]